MTAALAALAGAALTCLACYALGSLFLVRWNVQLRRIERFPLAFLLGASVLHLIVFAVMVLRIGYRPLLIVLLAGIVALSIRIGGFRRPSASDDVWTSPPRWTAIGGAIIFAAYCFLYFVNAWAPESSPDGAGYHLELVSRYFRAQGFEQVTTNMYAGLSEGLEMLFIPAFSIGRHSAAALVHFFFAVVLAWSIFGYGSRIGKPMAGAAAALLTFASPIVGITASSAYVDVAAAAVVFSVFYWLQIWDESRDPLMLIPIGLMAGYGYAVKYTAGIMVLYAAGFLLWRARKLRPVVVASAWAGVMILPWVIKNWVWMQNPIAPLGNALFRNPYMFPLLEQEWTEYLRSYGVDNKWSLPLEVTIRGFQTQGVLGAVFLAVPLALLALRFPAGRRVLVPGFLFLGVYFSNIGTRFLIPALPFFSLALAMALDTVAPVLALLVLTHAVLSWPRVLGHVTAPYAWNLTGIPWKAALRKIPEDRNLRERSSGYVVARMIDQLVPKGQMVYTANGIPGSYSSRELVVAFESGFGITLKDIQESAWIDDMQQRRVLRFRFPSRRARRIRLLQTAALHGPSQWSVTELRFFSAGRELPRATEWRLRAFPNPWNVQLAFDNSPVTRWRTWETAAPGMYLDVDFGKDEQVDEVVVETSQDADAAEVELQAMDQDRWTHVAQHPEKQTVPVPPELRRMASAELLARGIHYILIQDGDFNAKFVRDDPDDWGFRPIGRGPGATLFEVQP